MRDSPKYDPLRLYLLSQAGSSSTLRMSFGQVEEVLGSPLPASARRYSAWWLDRGEVTTHVQSHAWVEAGWKVDRLDLAAEQVTFHREHS